ncbi:hypothetical protein [Flagellimonas zhangzhouensis]|uniref:Uncharacterized protein n=1 Tax=Flagellimonas zhangzhouensis TaxID=1073328 RepID=A0A1H2X2T2_9FLAO|nr:hypothetical protein [Allomuricauda zhangzhouensis]SDQ27478.1 hypothetical protein SAMN05216294_1184 [Allomuricauda zhangzhouensis]SDW87180.1 hypothetical protein SAMN04487892_2564 [Allomuricauda zhangzhouensis]
MDITDIRFFEREAYLLKPSLLDSKKIEENLKGIKYSGQGRTVDKEVENSNIPYFATTFFHFVFTYDRIPNETELMQHYIVLNQISEDGQFLQFKAKPLSKNGVENRLLRSYPSLVRDFHFFKLCTESKNFDAVKYSLKVDIEDGVDLMIQQNEKIFCVSIFTQTPRAKKYKDRKNRVRHDYKNCFKQIEFSVDLSSKNIVKVSNFLLLSQTHVALLAKQITSYAGSKNS